MKKKNIAVIGTGHWGMNLVRNFHTLEALRGICDQDRDRLCSANKKFPDTVIYSDIQEIADDREIQGVVVATNAVTHYSITKKMLLAGHDVFVEKPLAMKFSEGEELVKIAHEKGKMLFIGHIMEYHPAVKKLNDLLKNGELGKIQYVYSNRLNLGKVRQEENILFSFAPHDIAVILRLLNEEPEHVYAVGASYLTKNVADITVTHLKFRSGVSAHIFVSWLHPYKDQRLVVIGDRKMAVFNDVEKENKLLLYEHKFRWINRIPVPDPANAIPVPFDNTEPLRIECEEFLKSIETRKNPLTDGESALRVLKVLELSERSLNSEAGSIPHINVQNPISDIFIHETAVIGENVSIGKGTKIWHFSHIMKNAKIGMNCILGHGVFIGEGAEIGNNVKIENGVNVFKGVRIKDNAFIGPGVTFTNVREPRGFIERKHEFLPTEIGSGATIGAHSVIVCGKKIGKFAFSGAGSVVTHDVADFELVFGNPAKHHGWVCRCGKKLTISGKDVQTACQFCNDVYVFDGKNLKLIISAGTDEDLSKYGRN
jgi:UDP-2-acetamido-3-amino-2,3-dideoxy-glucuronate N-acetyltransferase